MVVVNLDPQHMQHGFVQLPLADWGLPPDATVEVHDLLSDERYFWRGEWNYVRLDPRLRVAHILAVSLPGRSPPSPRSPPRAPRTWLDRRTLTLMPIAGDNDPLWYKDAIIYQAHVRAFFDSTNDGVGDFPGLTQKLDYLEGLGDQRALAAAVLSVAAARRRLRHRGLREHPPELRHARRLRPLHRGSAPPRHPRHHRAGHQPHVRPASVVPGGAARAGRLARARVLRLERDEAEVPKASGSSSPTPRRRTGAGTTRRRPTTGTGSSTTSRTSTSTTRPSSTR